MNMYLDLKATQKTIKSYMEAYKLKKLEKND